MKLLHNLSRRDKNVLNGMLAVFAAATVLLVLVIAISMAREETIPVVPVAAGGTEASGETVFPEEILWEYHAEPVWTPDQAEVEAIARTLYAECRGVESVAEKSAVAWCILNRVDDPGYPDTVLGVLEQPYQFAYDENAPLWPYLEQLAMDVLTRYHMEQTGETDVGRTLPAEYLYFEGDGVRNWFSIEWKSDAYWDWSLLDPYEIS